MLIARLLAFVAGRATIKVSLNMCEVSTVGDTAIVSFGGGGGRILRCIADHSQTDWLDLILVDTDATALAPHPRLRCLEVGKAWTRSQGCGGDVEAGERAVGSGLHELREVITASKLLIVVGCLGRGTASGGLQVISRLIREERAMAFFFVTQPFAVEGNGRREVADKALIDLRKNADVVVSIQNDLLFATFPADTRAEEAFGLADRFLADGVVGVAELMRCRGLLAVDFASLRTLLKNRAAQCSFGIGRARDAGEAVAAVDALFDSPMLGGRDYVASSDVVVATLLGGDDLAIGEIQQCLSALNGQLGDKTKSYIGANTVPGRGSEIQLTMICIHYRPISDAPQRPVQAEVEAAAETARNPARTRRRKRKQDDDKQISLPFVEDFLSVGIFGSVSATTHNGENLDIPTFQRQGLSIDAEP